MSDSTITFVILAVAVALFVWNRLPVEAVALGVPLALWATGILTIEQAVSGFGETTVLFIASLFVVSEALDSTGVTAWAGQQLIARAGSSQRRLLVLTMLLVALLTAVISVNGAVAALVPMVVVIAVRLGRLPSKLLLPLAFGAHAGSMLALTGTPVSVIVSDAAYESGAGRFGFFSFALVGVPLVAGVIAIAVLFGDRLLPTRTADSIPPDLSQFARTLAEQYEIDHSMARLEIVSGSPLIGRTRGTLDHDWSSVVSLTGVQRPGTVGLPADATLREGDVLVVSGRPDDVTALHEPYGVRTAPTTLTQPTDDALLDREVGVAELVVPPRSRLIGCRVFPGMVFSGSKVVVLAVQRNGEHLRGETVLVDGDVMLVQGRWQALEQPHDEVLVVDDPAMVRRQAVPLGLGARKAIVVVALMVVLLATGAVPAVVAGLLAAGALVLLNVVPLPQAYRSISWTTVVLVGGMTPLSAAMQQTGAAQKLADGLVDLVGDAGPYALVAGLFVLTAVLGQLISNMATALIVIPIAVSAAVEMNVSPSPVLMAVNVAAAAAFLTPVATPANLMVMGPGGYRFGDYWKLGGLMLVFFGLVSVFYVPLVWSF